MNELQSSNTRSMIEGVMMHLLCKIWNIIILWLLQSSNNRSMIEGESCIPIDLQSHNSNMMRLGNWKLVDS